MCVLCMCRRALLCFVTTYDGHIGMRAVSKARVTLLHAPALIKYLRYIVLWCAVQVNMRVVLEARDALLHAGKDLRRPMHFTTEVCVYCLYMYCTVVHYTIQPVRAGELQR